MKVKGSYMRIAVMQPASLLWDLTCHMGSHSVTWHPVEVTFSHLFQPIKDSNQFSDPSGMQG